jgi:hypothetical protein
MVQVDEAVLFSRMLIPVLFVALQGDAGRNLFIFVHALNVFVSFTPLHSLYKTEAS